MRESKEESEGGEKESKLQVVAAGEQQAVVLVAVEREAVEGLERETWTWAFSWSHWLTPRYGLTFSQPPTSAALRACHHTFSQRLTPFAQEWSGGITSWSSSSAGSCSTCGSTSTRGSVFLGLEVEQGEAGALGRLEGLLGAEAGKEESVVLGLGLDFRWALGLLLRGGEPS